MRIFSCFIAIIMTLTVILPGIERMHSGFDSLHSIGTSAALDVSPKMPLGEHSSHEDFCGMAVCGPLTQEENGSWHAVPAVRPVKYWDKNSILASVDVDVSVKPPRT
ncbi:hypothetical protein [Thalassospira mesophila]|uniref:hypothetical protein n=1 Tax=Thalassospira mesophila TaxID=1293891 RepID=UPI00117FF6AE|nr:hypothetical protein [Thalassospira mesophila]